MSASHESSVSTKLEEARERASGAPSKSGATISYRSAETPEHSKATPHFHELPKAPLRGADAAPARLLGTLSARKRRGPVEGRSERAS
jgi:hypothetical protein